MAVQSVLIPKTFSLQQASQWLTDHKLRQVTPEVTDTHYRFRQFKPCRTSYRTKTLDNGIIVVVEMRMPPPY